MRPRRSPFRFAVLLALTLLVSCCAFAGQIVNLTWDASPDTNVVGYYLYYGPAVGNYTNRIDAGTSLSISTPPLPDGTYYFTATSRNAWGVESDFANIITTNLFTDTIAPVVKTTWPILNTTIVNGKKCTNGTLVTLAPEVPFAGLVTDNGVITNITMTRTVPSWAAGPIDIAPVGAANAKRWTNVVSLVDGTNTFVISATDSAGLTTTLVRMLFLRTTTRLGVTTNGYGSTVPTGNLLLGSARDGAGLDIGRNYSIKAVPKTGNWFVNWTDGSGATLGTNLVLTFRMTNNLSITANFVTNGIVAGHLAGAYNGLFAESDGVRSDSAGSLNNVLITSTRSFSGKLSVAGTAYLFSGALDPLGNSTKTILRSLKSPIVLTLHLDFNNGTQQITGNVACDGEQWTSPLLAYLSVYSAVNRSPTAARYTMAIPPLPSSNTNAPVGYGYGLITNSPAGLVIMTGALADMTSISASAPISKNGDWPVYVNLYSHQGLLYGWVNLASGAPTGHLAWIKPSLTQMPALVNKMYPAGVNDSINVFGSIYRPATSPIALSTGDLELDVSANNPSTYPVTVTNSTRIVSPSHISGTVATTTGLVTLSLPSTVVGIVTRAAYGVVLQSSNTAVGTVSGINAAIHMQ